MHRQRAAIIIVAAAGILGCFFPGGSASIVRPIAGILIARKIVLGLLGMVLLLTLTGRRSRTMRRPALLGSSLAAALAVAVSVCWIIAHTMPSFADDDPRAGAFYRRACHGGAMSACVLLGRCYWSGTCGLAKDDATAIELFERACDGKDMSACGELAVCYELGGCGLRRDNGRAVSLYEKACVAGEMDMCNNLGVCYHKGQCGLSRDSVRASELYKQACNGGYSGACHNLELIKE